MPVEIIREGRDAPPAIQPARFPIGARDGIEMRLDAGIVGGHIVARSGGAEEAQKRLVIGQMAQRRELQSTERDMRAVEVDGADAGRVRREIRQDVAATRRDRDQMIVGAHVERRHVDDRILPDLRIDETAEREGEEAFQKTGARKHPAAVNRTVQVDGSCASKSPCRLRHRTSRILVCVRSALGESHDG
jgi:hypothetical protein